MIVRGIILLIFIGDVTDGTAPQDWVLVMMFLIALSMIFHTCGKGHK